MSGEREGRVTEGARQEEDATEGSLRPQTLKDFIGQQANRENLEVFFGAARARGERSISTSAARVYVSRACDRISPE